MHPRIYRKPSVGIVWTYVLMLIMVGIPTIFGKSLKDITIFSGLGAKHPQWIQVNPQKDLDNLKRYFPHAR